jgi:small membrane protein
MTVIKILLIIGVVGLLLFLLRSHGTNRGGAYVKIGMAVFLAFAAYAVIRPDDVTWVAGLLGVGRGADLVLYVLVVGFGFFAISTYLRFKELELKYARLARAIALNEADQRDHQHHAASAAEPGAPTAGSYEQGRGAASG